MGSSASANEKPKRSKRSQSETNARNHTQVKQNHTPNGSNHIPYYQNGERESPPNYRDASKSDAKRKDLNKTNKKHANNIDSEQHESPIIAVHNGGNEKLEIKQESASEIKKNKKKNQKQNELDHAAMEQKHREEEAKRNARIGNLKDQLRRHVDEIRNTYDDVEVEFDTIQDLETDIKHLQKANNYSTLVDPLIRREDLYQKHIRARTRKAQLLMKISELAGVRLRHNNPNIADLSDENRASKLSAKFAELYDNEYTDLFEIYCSKVPSDLDEKVVSDHMKDCLELPFEGEYYIIHSRPTRIPGSVLTNGSEHSQTYSPDFSACYCYTRCKEAAAGQRKRLICLLHMKDDLDPDTTDSALQLRIKEFQKNVARFTIPTLQSSILSGITKVESLQPLLKLIKTTASGTNPYLRHYLDRCTELCWYTQIQDPAVALDFGVRNDLTDYRPYTKTGPVLDYIVWPILLLHEKGPMLYKGVAQFKGNEEEEGREHSKRLFSGRRRAEKTNKREPKPFDFIPGDEARDPTMLPRAEVYETVSSSWD